MKSATVEITRDTALEILGEMFPVCLTFDVDTPLGRPELNCKQENGSGVTLICNRDNKDEWLYIHNFALHVPSGMNQRRFCDQRNIGNKNTEKCVSCVDATPTPPPNSDNVEHHSDIDTVEKNEATKPAI